MIDMEMCSFEESIKIRGGNTQILQELTDKFRLWLKQQLHLPQDLSDYQLQIFIGASKFNLEKAKERLDAYYTLRNLVPELYTNRDPLGDDIKQLLKCFQLLPLPKLTPEKERITMCRITNTDSSMFDIWSCVKFLFMLLDMYTKEDTTFSNILIVDYKKMGVGHVLKCTPTALHKINVCLDPYGERTRVFHMINVSHYVEPLADLMLKIFKPTIFGKIEVHTGGIESLDGIIPKSILPEDYGGELPSMNTLSDMWVAELVKNKEWFQKEEKITTNESLRSNSVINPEDLFGVQGTFRKLDID